MKSPILLAEIKFSFCMKKHILECKTILSFNIKIVNFIRIDVVHFQYNALYVNPYEIYNLFIEISIVLHAKICFFRLKENLISASSISDFMHI